MKTNKTAIRYGINTIALVILMILTIVTLKSYNSYSKRAFLQNLLLSTAKNP